MKEKEPNSIVVELLNPHYYSSQPRTTTVASSGIAVLIGNVNNKEQTTKEE